MTTNGWPLHKLNELGFVGRGKSRHRPRNAPELYGGPYPFVQTADIMGSEFYITTYSQTYSETGLAQSKMWERDTLCITNAGANTGESAILGIKACFPDSVIAFIPDDDKSDVRFVKYYLDTIIREIRAITRGATQDNLSVDKLLTFDIPTPPIAVQRKIASVLSSYDELIDNNKHRIAILEEMAQAIYREWFVNFRFPGHQKVEFVASPLGQIPKGWNILDLYSAADVTYGFAFKSKLFNDEGNGIGVIRIRDIPKHLTNTFTTQQADDRFLVENGDILIGMDGDFHMCRWSGGEAYLNQRVARIRGTTELPDYVLFHSLKNPIEQLNKTIVGTTVAHLGKSHLEKLQVLVPPSDLCKRVHDTFDPIYQLEISLRRKNEVLRQNRNLLLPKLISGKLNLEELDIDTGELTEQLKETTA